MTLAMPTLKLFLSLFLILSLISSPVPAQEKKELAKLKDRGVIRIGYRSITILDQELLDKIAYEHG